MIKSTNGEELNTAEIRREAYLDYHNDHLGSHSKALYRDCREPDSDKMILVAEARPSRCPQANLAPRERGEASESPGCR